VIRLRLASLAALLALAGCGGGYAGPPDASLWVTRDRGLKVLIATHVYSGDTAAQALESVAKVRTTYGGAFIQAVDGLASHSHQDWFYYVNGYASDRGAADYLLHPGDVEWWDYRDWKDPGDDPLVVGAFPEPFLHGFDGKVRPAAVRYSTPAQRAAARRLARILHARSVAAADVPVARGANELLLGTGRPRFTIRYRAGSGTAGDPVLVVYSGATDFLEGGHYRFLYGTG
jgi:hypothetical protein